MSANFPRGFTVGHMKGLRAFFPYIYARNFYTQTVFYAACFLVPFSLSLFGAHQRYY